MEGPLFRVFYFMAPKALSKRVRQSLWPHPVGSVICKDQESLSLQNASAPKGCAGAGWPSCQALYSYQHQAHITLQLPLRLDSEVHLFPHVMISPILTCVWCWTLACPDIAFNYRPGLAATPSPASSVPTHSGLFLSLTTAHWSSMVSSPQGPS